MFNFKKEKNQTPPVPTASNKVNIENTPIHTMQDDKDILEGKKPQIESISFADAHNSSEFKNDSNTISQPDGNAANMAGNSSPFLNGASSSSQKTAPGENKVSPKMTKNTYTEPKKYTGDALGGSLSIQTKKSSVFGKTLFITAIILVVAAFAFGGYYFWNTRVSNNQASITEESEVASNQALPSETASEIVTEPPTEITPSQFSQSNPNYLPIDIGTATADSISKLFIEKASEVKDSGSITPVEFIVTDTNNDPVSFSAFNYISGMKLPVNILTSLGDKFSLYFFNDNGNMRMGMATEMKDKDKVTSGMQNEESSLVADLSPLFMGMAIKDTDKIFKNSTYNNFSIRYNNLDDQNLTSLDYNITDKYLVIGTSKQTLRSMLDKISE
jgi:hypothetical protein